MSSQTALKSSGPSSPDFSLMFMQAGFALVETGLRGPRTWPTRWIILVYPIGARSAYWALGFALQMGGVGALSTFGNDATLRANSW